ncbi:RNA polymerase sigma factor [Saccharothrix violaceirubra]|uniref:RNA polymerase sigma factor n=1 Tax=Saccharothrix violaceirubra TaxID=413306 RepID=A0A7W7T9H1_9PSEU|nr:sigma-70 family RNA polymerase sigma factor [Saccharothrix violaceirubra]MBB4969036.1 RNA polymerase sigma-70 factor (ECF subfamily) [Saccharothrix violaceirubra]
MDSPDAALADRVARGDALAFEQLVLRYSGRVFGVALRMLGDRCDAEDVTQEVFATAWNRLGELEEPAAVRTWLFRVAERRCLGILRARRCAAVGELPDSSTPLCTPAYRDPARVTETFAALTHALSALTEFQRVTWLLAEVHGLTYAQIAIAVGATEESVRGRLCRARSRLSDAMRNWR